MNVIPYAVYYHKKYPISRINYFEEGDNSICNDKDWVIGMIFYALRPDFIPIPHGMSLISSSFNESPPYQTTHVEIVSDPFHLHLNTVNFITYYSPVDNTIPLYFYDNDFSIKDNNQKKDKVESQNSILAIGGYEGKKDLIPEFISPVFVMWRYYLSFGDITNYQDALTKAKKIENDFIYQNFSCIERRCVPTLSEGNDIRGCLNICMTPEIQGMFFLPDSEEPEDPRLKQFKRKNKIVIILIILIILIIILTLGIFITRYF